MRILAITVAFLMLLVALVALAPAALLDARLDSATQRQLRLMDTEGTVWNGRGVVTGEARTWSLPLRWTVDPWSLLRGDVVITLIAANGGDLPRGTIRWRKGGWEFDGIALTLPAAALQGLVVRGLALAPGGNVTVDAAHFRWDTNGQGGGGDGAASAVWNGARVAGAAGNIALGTVNVHLTSADGGILGRVDNRGGDVRVDGEFTLGNAGSSVSATVLPLPSTPPAIQRALGALGAPDAAGAVRVQWRSGGR